MFRAVAGEDEPAFAFHHEPFVGATALAWPPPSLNSPRSPLRGTATQPLHHPALQCRERLRQRLNSPKPGGLWVENCSGLGA